jgi:hypothetical protein
MDGKQSNGHANGQQPNGHADHEQMDEQAEDINAGEEGGKAAASAAKLNTGSATKSTLPFEQL